MEVHPDCVESEEHAMGQRVAAQLAHAWQRRPTDEVEIVGPLERAGATLFAEQVRQLSYRPRVHELLGNH